MNGITNKLIKAIDYPKLLQGVHESLKFFKHNQATISELKYEDHLNSYESAS